MKYIFLSLAIFISGSLVFIREADAACDESRPTYNTADPYDQTTNCYTDPSSNKTYSVSSQGTPGLTESPDVDSGKNILGLTESEIRGDVNLDTIPRVIVNVIEFLLGVAGTISVVALIYHAVQMQLHSGITGDSSGVDKAKAGMKGAIFGFVIAVLAWFIVARVVDVLTTLSS